MNQIRSISAQGSAYSTLMRKDTRGTVISIKNFIIIVIITIINVVDVYFLLMVLLLLSLL